MLSEETTVLIMRCNGELDGNFLINLNNLSPFLPIVKKIPFISIFLSLCTIFSNIQCLLINLNNLSPFLPIVKKIPFISVFLSLCTIFSNIQCLSKREGQESSVSITRLQAGWQGFDSRLSQVISLLHSFQTGSGAHPASYGNGGLFPWKRCTRGVKLRMHLHLLLRPRVESYLHSPMSSWRAD
jgi:hypothetical protein